MPESEIPENEIPENEMPEDVLLFELEEVYRKSGSHADKQSVRMKNLLERLGDGTEKGQRVVLLYWPRSMCFLKIEIDYRAQDKSVHQFAHSLESLRSLLIKCGVDENRIVEVQQSFQDDYQFLIGEVDPDGTLAFDFTVNTGDPAFLRETDDELDDGLTIRPELQVWNVLPGVDAAIPEVEAEPLFGTVPIHLVPATEMDVYEGFVSLDFGNTTSTVASLSDTSRHVDDVQIVNADDQDGTSDDSSHRSVDRAVQTAVRINEYLPPPEKDEDVVPQAKWDFGKKALDAGDGWLVLGAKRLLADPNQDEPHQIVLGARRRQIPKHITAELFIASMFKGFYRRHRRQALPLAVTYPSTFSIQEIGRLRKAVAFGWGRSLIAEEYPRDKEIVNELIPLMLDEASAAAFFFLYRDFIRGAGRTSVFHYLYPNGVNLLLYDCGGGTTDIALVHARPRRIVEKTQDANGPDSKESWEIDIEVLGRTGLRNFGGDDITIAVFKLLKAELGCFISQMPETKGAKLTFPDRAEDFPRFLEENDAQIERYVPTRFEDLRVSAEEDYELRRDATMALWTWAESVKRWLGLPDEAEPPRPSGDQIDSLFNLVARYSPNVAKQNCDAFFREFVKRFLKAPGKRRAYVDVLVRDPIMKSIHAANRMTKTHLTDATRVRAADFGNHRRENLSDLPADSAVHWVYVVGNASRYPLVRELLKEHLGVRDVNVDSEQSRLKFDENNLKTSVAKGAVLALRVRRQWEDVTVNWDSDLAERLPYTISHDSLGRGPQALFLEHQRYVDLEPQAIPVPKAGRDKQDVTLDRAWPGDERPEAFLDFKFTQPLQGPLWVRYEEETRQFVMHDEGIGEEITGVEKTESVYVAPVQQGNL